MSAVDTIIRSSPRLPDIRAVHWLPRILLAAIIAQQGFMKIPLLAEDAASFGVPFILWVMAALGEIAAAAALIVGGLIRNPLGDIITRLGGAALALITLSVLIVVYWAPLIFIFQGNQLHLLLIVGGLYFAARGNRA